MTQPGQNIQGNQGDVIGAGVGGSGNVLGKNVTVQTVQGNVINLTVTPEALRSLNQVNQVPTEVKPEASAGIQGSQVPQDLAALQGTINQLLEVFNRAGASGKNAAVVQAGDVQVSKVDLLVKKAVLLRAEADQMLIEGVGRSPNRPSAGPGGGTVQVNLGRLKLRLEGFNQNAHHAKLQEAYGLLDQANKVEPTNTEVLLHMARLLMVLTPDDPTDEQRLLLQVAQLLQEPRDETEKFRLAQATYLLAGSSEPMQRDLLQDARDQFASLGKTIWVKQCDDWLASARTKSSNVPTKSPKAPRRSRNSTGTGDGGFPPQTRYGSTGSGYRAPPPQPAYGAPSPGYPAPQPQPPYGSPSAGYGGPLAQMPFQPVGRWHIQVGDAMGSTMNVNLAPNGTFMAQQTAMGMNLQAAGQWAFVPQNQMLQLQGLVNGFQPFMLGIVVQGQQGNGYFGVGTDGYPYQFTRS